MGDRGRHLDSDLRRRGMRRDQALFGCTHGGLEFGFLAPLFIRLIETHERRRHFAMIRKESVLVLVTEHRSHREVVALGNRVVLMVVATGALHRQTHESVTGGHHAVIDAILAEFLGDRTTLESHAMQAIVGRGYALVLRRAWQKVSGELFGQELVVGLVIIEGLEHPIAPRPGEHGFVTRIAPGVGVP